MGVVVYRVIHAATGDVLVVVVALTEQREIAESETAVRRDAQADNGVHAIWDQEMYGVIMVRQMLPDAQTDRERHA